MKFRHAEQTVVVGDRANNHGDFVSLALCVTNNARKSNGWPVDLAGHKTLQDHLIEIRVRAASKEAIKLKMN